MAQQINIANKASGDSLTAGEFNNVVNTTNAAIAEQNQTKTDHAAAIAANAQALAGKVDKVTGKGLSTEDYTTEEKMKLAGLSAETGASIKAKLESLEGDDRIDASAVKGLSEVSARKFNPIRYDPGTVFNALAITPTGEIFLGGSGLFDKRDQYGNFLSEFPTDLTTSEVSALRAVSNGVLVGHYSGNYIDKIDFDGIVDESFAITASAPVIGIAVDDDGAIYVADYSETVKKYVAGVEDETFQFPGAGLCRDLLFHNGYLYAAMYNEGEGTVIRMTKTAVVDPNFFIGPLDEPIWRMAILNNKIFIGGNFEGFVKKYNLDGTIDESFYSFAGAPIYAIAPIGSNLLIGGQSLENEDAYVVMIDQNGNGVMNDISQTNDWYAGEIIVRNRFGQFIGIRPPWTDSGSTLAHSGQENSLPYWPLPAMT